MKILALNSGVDLVKTFKFEYYGDGGPYLNSLCSKRTLPLTDCLAFSRYSKTCVKRPSSKRQKIGFQSYQLSLNAGQTYCRMLQREHSAILSTFIKQPVAIKTFILSIFEWPFYTGFSVHVTIGIDLNPQ